ncbi:hypothetical protein [Planomonospora sp. ID67723]|uniref:hypothetical protein n=1 Tax=Planomonospora sp. ID67723 TaxID=2738134 RepID=UPI0027DB3A5A|nr:hypothetical protein [Planomonospora sp. ID67723]
MREGTRPVRMHFDPEEAEEFEAVKDLLIRRCTAWAGRHRMEAGELALSVALDSRHHSADGRLGYWTPREVRETLLRWMPRQMTADPGELGSAPESLRTLLCYLASSGLLDPRGATLAELGRAVTETAREYPEAVVNPYRWGLVKFWAMTAREHGVDPADDRAFAEFQRDVEAGRVRYDERVLGYLVRWQTLEPGPGQKRTAVRPPVSLASDSEIDEAAASSMVVRDLVSITGWAGADGRPLTGGKLQPQDAFLLEELLGIGGSGAGAHAETDLLLKWAKKTALVRVSRGRLRRVARSAPLLSDPRALWWRAFEAFFELGGAICVPPGEGAGPSLLAIWPGEIVSYALDLAYGWPRPVPMTLIQETAWCAWKGRLRRYPGADGPQQEFLWRIRFDQDLERAFTLLAGLGVVELSPDTAEASGADPLEEYEREGPLSPEIREAVLACLPEPPPLVRLTPLGTWAVRERMLAWGRDLPLVGELVAAAPAELLGTVADHYPPETARAEVDRWLAAHGEDVEPLLRAVRECPFRTRAAAMLDVLVDCLDDGHAILERLRHDPVLGPTAIQALLRTGVLEVDDLTDREQTLVLAEGLLTLLELGRPEEVRKELDAMAGRKAPEVAKEVLRSGHPAEAALEEFRLLVAEPMWVHRRPRRLVRAAPGSRGRPGGHGRKRRR